MHNKQPNDGRPILDFEIKIKIRLHKIINYFNFITKIMKKKEKPLKKIKPIKPEVEPKAVQPTKPQFKK